MTMVVIDTSVVVALADAQDKWHEGRLNYHDALMALACRELGVGFIVSFDGDCDNIAWLERILETAGVALLTPAP